MGEANPIVLVIDDDPEFRDSIVRLLRTVGLEPGNFRLFSIFSRLIRQSAPPAWCST
jgi:FixJ family two-component response regulator